MEQIELIQYVVALLERVGVPYFIVGSHASMHYGEDRLTNDVDVVCDLKRSDMFDFILGFPPPRYLIVPDAVRQAIDHRFQFNVLENTTGLKVDFMMVADSDWGRRQMERRRSVYLTPDFKGYVAAPEDVIIGKLVYYTEGASEKHLRDIATMIRVKQVLIDLIDIETWAAKLNVLDAWNAVQLRLNAQ